MNPFDTWGALVKWLEQTVDQVDGGSIPPLLFRRLGNFVHPTLFTPLCLCLSEDAQKAVGPFYLVSMPGEVKDPMQGNGKNL